MSDLVRNLEDRFCRDEAHIFVQQQVKMEFTPPTVRPGHDVNLHLEASPDSTCFVGMVDKSINLLGGSNQLTPSEVSMVIRIYLEFVDRIAKA